MKFSPRKQTFFHCFFLCSLIATWGVGGEWGGGEGRGQTTAGNFNFWLFGDRNVQGDEWVIQTRYLRYTQAFWGWIGGNIFSWQLCCIFCILTQTKSRVGLRSGWFPELIVDNKKNHSDVKIQLTGVITLLTAAGSLAAVTLATYQWPIRPIPRE